MIVGLTGGISTGKSTVSEMLFKQGIPVIDADRIAKMVVMKGQFAYEEIVKHFGAEILHPNGEINRAMLGEIVFNDPKLRSKLNEITHPAIFWQMAREITVALLSMKPLIVLDVPLLFESGKLLFWCSFVITVFCDEELQLKRLMARNSFTRDQALARISSQMPLKKKCEMSRYVIDNNHDLSHLKDQVDQLILKMYPSWTFHTTVVPLLCLFLPIYYFFF